MRAGWIVQGTPPASSICRACLQRFSATSRGSEQQWVRVASPSDASRRRFSNRPTARQEARAADQEADTSNSSPLGDLQRPKPRFGGLAGSRQPTGPSVEDRERAQFQADRERAQLQAAGEAPAQAQRQQQQFSRGHQNPRSDRKQDDKGRGFRQINLNRAASQQSQTTRREAQNTQTPAPGSFSISRNRSNNPKAESLTGKDSQAPTDVSSSSLPLPQRSRVLRQAPVEDPPQRQGWGSLKQRSRGESNGSAFLSGLRNQRHNLQDEAQKSYYAEATQREKDTSKGNFVGFNTESNNSALDQPFNESLPKSHSSHARSDRSERRHVSRFEGDDADEQGSSGGRPDRSLNTAPSRRNKSSARRSQKFEDEEADNLLDDMSTRRGGRDKKQKRKDKDVNAATPIELSPFMSVQSLAIALRQRPEDLVAKLEELGFEDVAMDHVLDAENAGLVAMEYNFEPVIDRSEEEDLFAAPVPEDTSALPQRPPVVTIMGHVDHGKTTILDYLRKSAIAASEHGGITQHIGAFVVPMASGKEVTFLDTPGHAAFLSMRERGANVTDIVILVVAADDSVKPQTIEAIKHAKAAKVPIIVAINKVDKDQADVTKVKQDLMVHDIEVEDFGGEHQAIEVSGKTGQGMDDLEEALITQAELLDMRAPRDGAAEGWIIEATTKRSGRAATVLVRRGTLRVGDVIVAGKTWARVRTLRNEAGVDVDEAGPGTPVEVGGWRDQPAAGDEVLQADTEQRATSVVRFRQDRAERSQAAVDMQAINEARRLEAEKRSAAKEAEGAAREAAKNGGDNKDNDDDATTTQSDRATGAAASHHTDLYFIVKADVSGSTEAVTAAIESIPLGNQPVSLHMLRAGVGPVSESDLDQIRSVPAGEGYLVSFNQPVAPHVALAAERGGVRLLDHSIIYKVIDGVREVVEGHLPPVVTSRVLGDAEIAQAFDIKVGRATQRVAGCRVRNGAMLRDGRVRVYRGGDVSADSLAHDGELASLRSHKRDAQEIKKGAECGLSIAGWDGWRVGDVVQCYEERRERRRLT